MKFFKALREIFSKRPSDEPLDKHLEYLSWGMFGYPFPVGCFFIQQERLPNSESVDANAGESVREDDD